MGSLSMTTCDSHTKCHRPPERSSDLLGASSNQPSDWICISKVMASF
jgi:hypothetical protein